MVDKTWHETAEVGTKGRLTWSSTALVLKFTNRTKTNMHIFGDKMVLCMQNPGDPPLTQSGLLQASQLGVRLKASILDLTDSLILVSSEELAGT